MLKKRGWTGELNRTTGSIVLVLTIQFLFSFGCTQALVKDPWDMSPQPRYYQLAQMSANNKAKAAFRAGCYAVEKGNLKQAKESFHRAYSLDRGFWEALYERGRVEHALSEYDAAFTTMEEALQKSTETEKIRAEIEEIRKEAADYYLDEAKVLSLEEHDLVKKEELLKEALAFAPMNDEIYFELGALFNQKNNLVLAEHYLLEALERNENSREAGLELLRLYLKTSNINQASELLKKFLILYPADINFLEIDRELKKVELMDQERHELLRVRQKTIITRGDLSALIISLLPFHSLPWSVGPPPANPMVVLDISSHWAKPFIKEILEYRIMEPFPNHTFQPEKRIMRFELAEILDRILNKIGFSEKQDAMDTTGNCQVSDVFREHLSYASIERVLSLGLMNCDENERFLPDQFISGSQAFDIILRLKKVIAERSTNKQL